VFVFGPHTTLHKADGKLQLCLQTLREILRVQNLVSGHFPSFGIVSAKLTLKSKKSYRNNEQDATV